MEVEQDLRSASDTLLRTLDQLEVLESEKRTLKPDNPRFHRLASEIERLAATVFAQTYAQKQLGQMGREMAARTGVDLPSIDETDPGRDLHVILTEWRTAERLVATVQPDTAEHAKATADIRRLREEYHRTYSAQARPEAAQS